MNLLDILNEEKYNLAGNCVYGLDDPYFRRKVCYDATEMAGIVDEYANEFLSSDEFLQNVNWPSDMGVPADNMYEFAYNEAKDIYWAYNIEDDVHFFFVKDSINENYRDPMTVKPIKLADLIFEESFYSGTTMSKNTSIVGGVTEGVSYLYNSGKIQGKVLDYGAGRVDRNAKFLRANGLEVYSYDPFWGSGDNGYETTSDKLPSDTFDVGYTSYVLNVVSFPEQADILNTMSSLCKKQFHIVRFMDLYDLAKKNLQSDKDNLIKNFFTNQYKGNLDNYLNADKEGKMQILTDFLEFGTETSNGFQRLVSLENQGFSLIRKTSGYRIYEK